jgi:hypothetical protein
MEFYYDTLRQIYDILPRNIPKNRDLEKRKKE